MHRSVLEFVEDMLSDGRTRKEIIAIANSCHWRTRIDEITEELDKFSKKRKNYS